MDSLLVELRHAWRSLQRSPAFTGLATLTLALGIGGTTAIFTLVDAVLLRALPFADPSRLMMVWSTNRLGAHSPVSPADFLDWRAQTSAFDDLAGIDFAAPVLSGSGEPQRLRASLVSASFFQIMGVAPVLGRTFVLDEDGAGAPPVAVLGHALWQQRFGGDTRAVGRAIVLDGVSHTVVGVMPGGFEFPSPLGVPHTDLWLPLALNRAEASRGMHSMGVVGRLDTGITPEQAQADMTAVAGSLAQLYPQSNATKGARIVPLHEELVGDVRPVLYMLGGAVLLVLLVACANVANLLLARSTTRSREVAVRAALGAGRRRLVGQLLTESLLLSLIGAFLGWLIALWGIDLLPALAGDSLPRVDEVSVDVRVLSFTLLLAVATTFLFGLAPALKASTPVLAESLKSGGWTAAGSRRLARARDAIIVCEVALAFALLVGSGLLLRSFDRLLGIDPGFDARDALSARITLPLSRYPSPEAQRRFVDELVSRVSAISGVQAAGVTTYLPFSGHDLRLGITIEGRPSTGDDDAVSHVRDVTAGYFAAMGIPILEGRALSDHDARAIVVSGAFARRYFAGERAVGRRVKLAPPSVESPWLEIVGVVGDVRHHSLARDVAPTLYTPFSFDPPRFVSLVARTDTGDPSRLLPAVRTVLRALDPELPLDEVGTLAALVSASTAAPRLRVTLVSAFATVALVLSALGLYGVVSYAVAQRTREFGVRVALGADARRLRQLVLARAAALGTIGLLIGFPLAAWSGSLIRRFLFQVEPLDPVTLSATAGLLLITALAASVAPARRAARVDPMVTMREQ